MTKLQFTMKILTNPNEIIKFLQIGINIPILPEFKKIIIKTFNGFNVKAILLEENIKNSIFIDKTDFIDKVVGITIIYDGGNKTLFFGFFGTYDHDEGKIAFLMNSLIKYAVENDYDYIRGPVNIPAVIFGWGFMVEGSNKSLFICCPVNPPIYQKVFLNNGFYVKFEEDRYNVPVLPFDPYSIKKKNGTYYDYSDYEYTNPSKTEVWDQLNQMVDLHLKYMPPSAQISPMNPIHPEVHIEFIHKFGLESHIWSVFYKPTKEMVACGYIIPNPFSRDKRNRLNSASFHDWVVHPEHRRAGLAMLMYGVGAKKIYKEGMRYGSWPVGSENIANATMAQKMQGIRDRRHLILEYKIQ